MDEMVRVPNHHGMIIIGTCNRPHIFYFTNTLWMPLNKSSGIEYKTSRCHFGAAKLI